VTTVAREFYGYKNVKLDWSLSEKTRPRPYGDLIENYNPSDYAHERIDDDEQPFGNLIENYNRSVYAEECIDQMFELDQANALKEYLHRNFRNSETTTIKKAKLPIPNKSESYLAYLWLDKYYDRLYGFDVNLPDYSLPFRALCYFNVRGCEPADDSEASQGRL
jgi:hypothetical protein